MVAAQPSKISFRFLQPNDGAEGRVNNVEVSVLDGPYFRDVGLDESDAVGEAGTLSEISCRGNRGIGKVDASHAMCTQSGQGERVHAEVTLQVEQALAGNVTHRCAFDLAKSAASADETLNIVELAADVDWRHFVPAPLVGLMGFARDRVPHPTFPRMIQSLRIIQSPFCMSWDFLVERLISGALQ